MPVLPLLTHSITRHYHMTLHLRLACFHLARPCSTLAAAYHHHNHHYVTIIIIDIVSSNSRLPPARSSDRRMAATVLVLAVRVSSATTAARASKAVPAGERKKLLHLVRTIPHQSNNEPAQPLPRSSNTSSSARRSVILSYRSTAWRPAWPYNHCSLGLDGHPFHL